MKKRRQLKWSMMAMLTMCWFIPLIVLSFAMLFFVYGKMSRQLQNTIVTSADQAIDMCQIRLNEAMAASKDSSYLPEIKDSYAAYLADGDVKELNRDVNLFLQQHYRYNSDFRMTVLYFLDNPDNLFYTYQSPQETYAIVRYFQKNVQEQMIAMSEELDTDIAFVSVGDRSYMVRNIVNGKFEPIAMIVMELDTEHMFGSLKSIWGYRSGQVYIDDSSMLEGESKNPMGDSAVRMMKNAKYFPKGDRSCVYKRLEAGRHRIDYVVMLDPEALTEEILLVRSIIGMLFLFMIPLVIVVFVFFNRHVNRPVAELRKGCKEMGKEHYSYRIEEQEQDEEFYELHAAFNGMADKLQYQFEKIYLEELALKDANIMALQSQINPHFLNNTLEIINWEARMNGNLKVSSMIEALSTMLEATMNRAKVQLIPLSEELSYVDAYLYIISQRFGDNFECKKQIDENLLSVKVPRLIIQPIIENAVEHGMNFHEKGRVELNVYRDQNRLCIEVMDNGVLTGKDKDKIRQLLSDQNVQDQPSLSIGIRNVNKRLKIMYGEEYGLTILSNAQGYTVSTITVKIEQEGNQ
jgi:sensor histidine kinase YesM